MTQSSTPVIELRDLTKRYGLGDAAQNALEKINLRVDKGEFIVIMGPSGCGKTTLLNIMGLLDRADSGEYFLNGTSVASLSKRQHARIRSRQIGIVFQSFNLINRLTVLENVALPLSYRGGMRRVKRLEQASAVLKNFHLQEREYYMPWQLSGGQVQRVAIARALVNHPSIILADEPTGNLDSRSSHVIMEELAQLHRRGNTIIMVTHNPNLTSYASRVIKMLDGQIASDMQMRVTAPAASTTATKAQMRTTAKPIIRGRRTKTPAPVSTEQNPSVVDVDEGPTIAAMPVAPPDVPPSEPVDTSDNDLTPKTATLKTTSTAVAPAQPTVSTVSPTTLPAPQKQVLPVAPTAKSTATSTAVVNTNSLVVSHPPTATNQPKPSTTSSALSVVAPAQSVTTMPTVRIPHPPSVPSAPVKAAASAQTVSSPIVATTGSAAKHPQQYQNNSTQTLDDKPQTTSAVIQKAKPVDVETKESQI